MNIHKATHEFTKDEATKVINIIIDTGNTMDVWLKMTIINSKNNTINRILEDEIMLGTATIFLLFIIPGLIFVIYWTFAIFVLVDQKKKPGASLKTSMNLVKNNWWRTFGYLLLFNIIISAFYLLITFVLGLLAIPIAHFNLLLGTWYLIFISSLLSLFITPFSLLFLYNFYLKQKSL